MLRPLVCIAALCVASSACIEANTVSPSTPSSSVSLVASKAPETATASSNKLLEMVPFDLSWLHAVPRAPSSLDDQKLDHQASVTQNRFVVDPDSVLSHNQAAMKFDQSLLNGQNSMVEGKRRLDSDEDLSTLAANNQHYSNPRHGSSRRDKFNAMMTQQDQFRDKARYYGPREEQQNFNQDQHYKQMQGMNKIVDSYNPNADRRSMGSNMDDYNLQQQLQLQMQMQQFNNKQNQQQRSASHNQPQAFKGKHHGKGKGLEASKVAKGANRRMMNVGSSRQHLSNNKVRGQESRRLPTRPHVGRNSNKDDDDEIFRDDDETSSSGGPMSGSSSSDRRGDGSDGSSSDYDDGGLDSDSSDSMGDSDGYQPTRDRDSSVSRPQRHNQFGGLANGLGYQNGMNSAGFGSGDSSLAENSGDGSDEDSDASIPKKSTASLLRRSSAGDESNQADASHVTSSKSDLQAAAGHHHKHHGHYYQHVEVPKKKAWKFGFKRGNHKHEIERHEKGYKHKFHSSFKWHAKEKCKKKHKCKSVGKMTWDYKHHKKHHHG